MHYSPAFTRYCDSNISYHQRQHFLPYRFTNIISLLLIHVVCIQDLLEKNYAEFSFGLFWFGSVKQTDLLSIFLPSVDIYVIKLLWVIAVNFVESFVFVQSLFSRKKSPEVANLPLTDETFCLSFWLHKQDKWLFQFPKLSSGSYA